MVLDRQTFDALVDKVYRASTGEMSWQAALHSVASAFDASFSAISVERCELSQLRLEPSEIKPEPVVVHTSKRLDGFQELYFEHFHRLDPFRLSVPIAFEPSILRLQDVCDLKDFARSEYYRDFTRLSDSFHLARFTTRLDAELQLSVIMNRPESGDPLDDLELARFDSLTTHILRALKVERAMTRMGATMGAAFDALDNIGRAALLVDNSGRIVRMNARAEAIGAAADGLKISRNKLLIEHKEGQKRLRNALTKQLGEDPLDPPSAPVVLAIERPSGARPYLAEVTPFEFENYGGGVAATALITITDPGPRRTKLSRDWGKALGLTRSEWRVARTLVDCHDESEAAETLGISVNTVKTHRKNIYAKLGIRRRAELSSMLPGSA